MSLSYTTHRVNMKFHISSKTPDFNPLKYLKLATSCNAICKALNPKSRHVPSTFLHRRHLRGGGFTVLYVQLTIYIPTTVRLTSNGHFEIRELSS